MNGAQGGNLQNVLSISTAANNRYLLHFNSLNSLTQWTAGIRLAMFEHATLQEAYTGSLVAGKGKLLNNIKTIMERSKFITEDWARVRFGAGTPWRRCWCVISPPDEKEYAKAQKTLKKKTYDRAAPPPKGDIKFYDTRKVTKKTRPIATIKDAYAAYAIYPQSKPLIDQSTLVKLEGLVTIHTSLEQTTEGFVFVMPEVHPAVTGFEMMLRWLFPVFDTFALYGRPNKLIADTLDQRGLMFAMPRDRRYGYLDILDVSGLIHTEGSQAWSERQWRREMKKLTSTRMSSDIPATGSPRHSRAISQRRNTDTRPGGVKFQSDAVAHSSPGSRSASPVPVNAALPYAPPRRVDSAPPQSFNSPHKRSVSDAMGYRQYQAETPSRLSHEMGRPYEDELPPPPPAHRAGLGRSHGPGSLERITSEAEVPTMSSTFEDMHIQDTTPMPAPVASPPAFLHNPSATPPVNQRSQMPELRRAKSNLDAETMRQLQDATRKDRPQEEDYGNVYNPQTLAQNSAQNSVTTTNTTALANRNLGTSADRSQGVVNTTPINKPRDPRQTLPTIEQSPWVGGDQESFEPVTRAYSAAPPVPEHSGVPQLGGSVDKRTGLATDVDNASRPDLRPARSNHSIARKAVPKPLPVVPQSDAYSSVLADEPSSPSSPSSHGSLTGALIDHDALERILNEDPDRRSTMRSNASFATDDTPDYASTASVSTRPEKRSMERPRAGKLKVVGDPELPQRDPYMGEASRLDPAKETPVPEGEMPTMDFGPTLLYKPSTRPGTSGTITPGGFGERERSSSRDRLRESSTDRLGTARPLSRISPGDAQGNSYFSGRGTPSPIGMTPTDQPGDRRSVAWQPASGPGTPGSRQSLTPEQWVQQRAAMAAQPQQPPSQRTAVPLYAHQRQDSSGNFTQMRRSRSPGPNTPPLSRTPSGDWTQQGQRLSRPTSGDRTQQVQRTPPGERPRSRGSGMLLNPPSPGGLLQNSQPSLTAKEQMHVARATGTPLLSMPPKDQKKQQEEQAPGLIGALAAREREKAAIKEGMRGGMVQQAIQARQQQQYQMEYDAQQQAQLQAQQQWQQQMNAQQFQNQAYQKVMLAQNQAPINYPQRQPQRPALQTQRSSGYYSQGYGNASPSAVANAYTTSSPQSYAPNTPAQQYPQPQQGQQQPYGASYFNNQAGQYGQQRRY